MAAVRAVRAVIWTALLVGLFAASWRLSQIDPRKLLQPAPTFRRVLGDFVTIDLSPDVLQVVFRQILTTIFQALVATTLGSLAAAPFSFLAAQARSILFRTSFPNSLKRKRTGHTARAWMACCRYCETSYERN